MSDASRAAVREGPDAAIPVARRIVYSALTLLAFALLLEAALALLGLGEENRLLASRGFAHNAHYVVADEARPGGWRVLITGSQQDAIEVPPRSELLRVLLLGGSNAAGWPTNVFRTKLDAALPAPGFEVFNLGRAGYGSERMRILLEQSLVLEPDIIVLHEGHNEFVERGFAWELLSRWKSPAVLQAVDGAMRLRALSWPVELLRARRDASGAGGLPGLGEHRDRLFEGLTYDQTEIFYDAYRENFAAMLAAARTAGVRVQLSTVIGNPFDAPMVSTPSPELSPGDLAALQQLRARALALIGERFRHGFIATPGSPVIRLDARDWGHLIPNEELQARLARTGLAPAPAMRPHTGVLAEAPFWNPPPAWSPRAAELMQTIAQIYVRQLTAAEAEDLGAARELYEQALALSPDHPDTLFEAGIVHYLLGDDVRAEELLRDAMDADRAPSKGNDVVNGILRELAAAHAADADFGFVDLDSLFRERCPQRLLGYEVMLDHCHPHLFARPYILDDLVPSVVALARRVLAER